MGTSYALTRGQCDLLQCRAAGATHVTRVLSILRTSIGFLTRVPVRGGEVSTKDLGWVVTAFPFVGALIGGALYATARLLGPLLPAEIVALCLLAIWIWLTGGLHVDGCADLADAFGAAHASKEKRLEVMKDPRVGAHGATAVGVLLLSKWVGLKGLMLHPSTILIAPVVARCCVVFLVAAFPYARSRGLGRGFHDGVKAYHLILVLVCLVAVLFWASMPAPVYVGAAATAMLLIAWMAMRGLGGLTGDVYGAAIEAGEAVALLAAVALL